MKPEPDGSFLFSPTDLVGFLEGDFAAWMERAWAESQRSSSGTGTGRGAAALCRFPWAPDDEDEESALVKRKGEEHEVRVLEHLRAVHGSWAEITRGEHAAALTLEAMSRGVPLIYQGLLASPPWHGYPDFLIRSDEPSELGAWSYWSSDSKLARSTKPYFLVQLCAYADLLEQAQGLRPARLGFILGDHTEATYETKRFFYFYRHLKATFERFQRDFDPGQMPDPSLEAGFGRWKTAAEAVLTERDDLRLIAGITRSQIKRLRDAGISTMAQLLWASGPRARINSDVLERLRRQARLQIASRTAPLPAFETLTPRPERSGLATLPPPSPGDVFFDLEGFPLAEGGLEYLFGAVTADDGTPRFTCWWAHDSAQETVAFEAVVDWLIARWRADPAMHIYHYASYEVTALRRLMGKYGSREDEVDTLLRAEALVDLFKVVRQGVAIGTPGYSLKDIEVLFAPDRQAGVLNAGGSTAEYQRWLDSSEPADPDRSPILASIRDYNREDCENTWRLAQWLRERQAEAGIAWMPRKEEPKEEEEPREEANAALVSHLMELAGRELDPARRAGTELLAWLLNYHRREEKPAWWRYFDRLEATDEELYNAAECLAGVRRAAAPPVPVKRSHIVEYDFDLEQDTKLATGDKVYLIAPGVEQLRFQIHEMDAISGKLWLKYGRRREVPVEFNLIPDEVISSKELRDAIGRVATRCLSGDTADLSAVAHLLERHRPRLRSRREGALISGQPNLPADLLDLVRDLDGTTLCIQGPPGSGKTSNAAAVIVALAAEGRRIGIASNSHKAVLNLMQAVARAADESGRNIRQLKVVGGDESAEEIEQLGFATCDSRQVAEQMAPGIVVGGSAWPFAREEMARALDYLFIDEAGQVSLANAVAMGHSAHNLILLGDQMQLAQPVQGTHPGESGLSCLHYVLQGHATVPPEMGVFLPHTWRLHPEICRFISDTAYDGRLNPVPQAEQREALLPGSARRLRRGTGIVVEEVAHEGNTQSSEEEAEVIAQLVGDLELCRVRDEDGERDFDRTRDLLIVAPYNAQVRLLREWLGADLRIASVDKFQGQEASVVIVSMCASSAEESPRGATFLLDPNRLNVAVSRARCLAVVVGSTNLVRARPGSVREMELLNLYCRLRYYAAELEGGPQRLSPNR